MSGQRGRRAKAFLLVLAEEENTAKPLQSQREEVVLDAGVLFSDTVARDPGGTDTGVNRGPCCGKGKAGRQA